MNTEIVEYEEHAVTVYDEDLEKEIKDDLEEARETYKELLVQGKAGLEHAKTLIEATEHPRAVEVFAGLINSLVNVNDRLVELQKSKKDLQSPSSNNQVEGKRITNNNVFVGSPHDLQKALAELTT